MSDPPPTNAAPSLLAQLQEPDELALIFNPIGLGPPIDAEEAAEHQAATISAAIVCDAVPESVRKNFDRARKLHLYGVLEYEFFTAAPEYALLVLEAALRLRFLSYYGDEIPVLRRQVPDILRAEDFDTVRAARKTRLRLPDGTGADLPVYLKGLLAWARRERLLPGRRSRIIDKMLVDSRNHSAHPTGRTIDIPPASSRMLRTVAEYINRLWGEDTPGGRHFAGPIARRPRVVALARDGSASRQFAPDQIRQVPTGARDWAYVVYLAAEEEELTRPGTLGLRLVPNKGFQATIYPCELLWHGEWEELAAVVDAGGFDGRADAVEYLDRSFLFRVGPEGPDLARDPKDLAILPDPPEGPWYEVVADSPHEALVHVRDHEPAADRSSVECERCLVDVAGRFATTADMLSHVQLLPRAMSRTSPGGSPLRDSQAST